jgi:LPXTG-motif cell wall-anchored protein
MLLKTGDNAKWGPIAGIAGGLAMLGALIFAASAFRELVRRRA